MANYHHVSLMTEIIRNMFLLFYFHGRFTNGMEVVISQHQIVIEFLGRTMAYRSQLPLALAWAVSVHKSQVGKVEKIYIHLSARDSN